MELLELLHQLDVALFYFFNVTLANPVLDAVMPFVTDKHSWYPVWAVTVIGLLWKGGRKGRWAVLVAILAVGLSDPVVSRIMKPLFDRDRPCIALEDVHLLLNRKTSNAMPSAHAANFFAVATAFSYFYRKYQVIFWFLASLVAYSRVAVGVHYPSDILVGSMVGAFFALFWIFLINKILQRRGRQLLNASRF